MTLARDRRWHATPEPAEVKSLREIADREKIDNGYVSRIVDLTPLAPDIVTAFLGDSPPNHFTLFEPAVDPPALRDEQRLRITQ